MNYLFSYISYIPDPLAMDNDKLCVINDTTHLCHGDVVENFVISNITNDSWLMYD